MANAEPEETRIYLSLPPRLAADVNAFIVSQGLKSRVWRQELLRQAIVRGLDGAKAAVSRVAHSSSR